MNTLEKIREIKREIQKESKNSAEFERVSKLFDLIMDYGFENFKDGMNTAKEIFTKEPKQV